MNNPFNEAKDEAIQRMMETNSRSVYKEAEKPTKPPQQNQNSLLGGLNIPFLENLKTDGDLTLILGILLLLLSEKADKRLLFALIYILL